MIETTLLAERGLRQGSKAAFSEEVIKDASFRGNVLRAEQPSRLD